MEILVTILMILIILTIGILANIGGFGGGIILIPILNLFFGFPLKIVIGTVLSSLFLPALIGVIFAARRKEINYRVAIIVEIPTIVGILIGSQISDLFSENELKSIFGCVALTVSILMLKKSFNFYRGQDEGNVSAFWKKIIELKPILKEKTDEYEYKVSIPFAVISGLFIGILAGLLGISGGWLKAPIMVIGFSIPPVIASGTALLMILITSLTGGLIHFFGSNWDFQLFLILTLTLSVGSLIGDRMKSKMDSSQISLVLAIILFLISIFTLVDVIF